MRARYLFVLAFAVGGCEALFGIRETGGSGGTGGVATTRGMGGAGSGSGAGASGGGAGGRGGSGGTTSSNGTGGSGGAACDSGVTPAFFCGGEPPGDFCADFDGDSGTYLTGWTDLNQVGNLTSASLDTSVFHSPGGSFRVDGASPITLDGNCQDVEASTRLAHPISASAAGVQIDFWHRRSGSLPTTGNIQDLDVNCEPTSGSTYGILNWGMRPNHYGIEIYGANGQMSDKDETLDAPPVNQWVRVHVELMFGAQGKVVVYHDCTNVYERDLIDTNCISATAKTLLIGMLTCTEVPAASLWFDDVVVKEL